MRIRVLYGLLLSTGIFYAQEVDESEKELQSTFSHSLNISGGTTKNKSGSLSFTVGQVYHEVSTVREQGSIESTIQRAVENIIEPDVEIENDNESIIVHPNPFTDHFVLKFTDGQYDLSNYSLFDLEGRLLLSDKIDKSQTRVNIGFLSSGLYILKVIKQNSITKSLKILKN